MRGGGLDAPTRKACASRRHCRARSSSFARFWTQRRDVGVRRAAVGRVVLEAAILGRIVRRRDDDAVREVLLCGRGCIPESRARLTGVGVTPSSRWMMVSTPLAASTSSAVRCAGPETRACPCPCRAGRLRPAAAVFADRLGDGQDVRLGEAAVQRSSAMAAGPEATIWAGSLRSGLRS